MASSPRRRKRKHNSNDHEEQPSNKRRRVAPVQLQMGVKPRVGWFPTVARAVRALLGHHIPHPPATRPPAPQCTRTICLIGPEGSGKTTLANAWMRKTTNSSNNNNNSLSFAQRTVAYQTDDGTEKCVRLQVVDTRQSDSFLTESPAKDLEKVVATADVILLCLSGRRTSAACLQADVDEWQNVIAGCTPVILGDASMGNWPTVSMRSESAVLSPDEFLVQVLEQVRDD